MTQTDLNINITHNASQELLKSLLCSCMKLLNLLLSHATPVACGTNGAVLPVDKLADRWNISFSVNTLEAKNLLPYPFI